MSQQVKKTTLSKNFYFRCILEHLHNNPCPICELAKTLNTSKQKLNYYIKQLRVSGVIKKIGYGTWEVNEEKYKELINKSDKEVKKQVKKSTIVALDKTPKIFTSDKEVRGHGFQLTLKIPKIKNWENRRQYLIKKNIDFVPVGNGLWEGERIIVNGAKIHLTPKSIVFYVPKWLSWFASTAKDAKNHVIYDILQTINTVERLLNIDTFMINKEYRLKVTRQHYGLVKNALAQQYNKEGKKLHCYTEKGLWLIIDNSFNLHELETVHPDKADTDNKIVQDFFNSLAQNPLTIGGILETFNKIANIQLTEQTKWGEYAEHISSHTKAIQQLNNSINKLTEIKTPLFTRLIKNIRGKI